MEQEQVERALVVVAHPDDVDFGAGGTIASWTESGIAVTYCICTDGDAGGFDPDVPRDQIGAIRQAEQRAAAKEVGVEDVVFLGYPDGQLTASFDLRRDISRVIRQVRPQRLLMQSPEINWERIGASHPDHRAAGEAALCAVYPDARNPFTHLELAAEGLDAWKVSRDLGDGGRPGRRHLGRRDGHLRAQGRRAAPARLADRPHGRPRRHAADLARPQRRGGGLPEGRLAEAFRVIDTR